MGYVEDRADLRYYKYLRTILAMVAGKAESILDVGSNGVDLISYLPCKRKVSIDIGRPLIASGVESIKGDFLAYESKEKFDVVTCFQVLEHIDDEHINDFASKLSLLGGVVVVSVPYMWTKGMCKWHHQDPVSEEKLCGWFNRNPVFMHNVVEENGIQRLIAVFVDDKLNQTVSIINKEEFFLKKINFNQEGIIRKAKRKENLMRGVIEKYAAIAISKLTDEEKAIAKMTKEEILDKAIKSTEVDEARKLFKIGESVYPFWLDNYNHPKFLKEWIRYLLSVALCDEAKVVLESKMDFYQGVFKKEQFKILFDRYVKKS